MNNFFSKKIFFIQVPSYKPYWLNSKFQNLLEKHFFKSKSI